MQLGNLVDWLEKIAPMALAEDYDNSGLILGDRNQEVHRVVVCLDADEKAMAFAREHGADLILSHHPFLFKPLKAILPSTTEGSLIFSAIRHDIALCSAHTNFDTVQGGMTDLLCMEIGLKPVSVLMPLASQPEHGLGRIGAYDTPLETQDFLTILTEKLKLNAFREVGRRPDKIKKVAVYNGSYDRDILKALLQNKPDCILTGDLKYHDALELSYQGLYVIDAGHYKTEILFVRFFAELLQKTFPELTLYPFEGEDVFRTVSG